LRNHRLWKLGKIAALCIGTIVAAQTAVAQFALAPATAASPSSQIRFNRDIRPILSDTCFKCHGFDRKARKADLRLDVAEEAFKPRKGGVPIVPGHPETSEAYLRLTSTDPDMRMPPPESHLTLTAEQMQRIRQWIAQGAIYEPHWAFIAPKDSPLPAVKNASWPKNPIDRFILARLEEEGLSPSPEADRRTLIRRLSLDLTGLAPTPSDVAAFLADSSADAYEKLVDRLLASPAYGERMALEWLDAARYADTNGYQADPTRTMWPWRDWVINAMNQNMPFDQFAVDQIAGDLIPGATTEQRLASGFNRNHPYNSEGGAIAEEVRVTNVLDRVDTTSTTFLGLTIGCAKCHDHKFDPITQKDYYSLYAYFNQCSESGGESQSSGNVAPTMIDAPDPELAKIAALRAEQRKAAAALAAALPAIDAAQAEWEKAANGTGSFMLLPPTTAPSTQPASPSVAGHDATKPEDEAASSNGPARGVDPSAEIRRVLALDVKKRSAAEKASVREYYRTNVNARFKALNAAVRAAEKAANDLEGKYPRVMVMDDATARKTHVLFRGQYDKPLAEVTSNTPGVLPPLPTGAENNRLALARWLVDPGNPLTARVIVNRYWQTFFGTGIVKTSDDFGTQGDPPSHPELLDYLAHRFISSGWDVKAMQRLIVCSAAYRQSSKVTPDLLEKDPANRLLARGARFRLSSFLIRDQALAASGLLVAKLGGPPVKPYQPPGVWEDMSLGKITYRQDHGESLYRRSIYTFWRRTVSPTSMFDVSARTVCTVRPSRTNTPLQALALENDPTYVEAARVLSQELLTQTSTPAQTLDGVFERLLVRDATATEAKVLLPALDRLEGEYRADPPRALQLLGVGESPRDPSIDPVTLASWTALVNTVMNMDETITKE